MGRWSKPVNAIAVAWVCFISVVLFFPPIKPVTAANMNYAICVAAIIAVISLSWWFISAKKYVQLIYQSLSKLTNVQYVYRPSNQGDYHRGSNGRSRVHGLIVTSAISFTTKSLKSEKRFTDFTKDFATGKIQVWDIEAEFSHTLLA
jgi:hypothetical protein